eukprot:XP_001698426.1 predicted protein [Chlamydomonas reinhardtii]
MPVPPEPQLQPQLEAQPEQPQPAGPRTTALPKPAAQLRGAEDVPAAAPATAAAVEGSAPGVPGGLASQWILLSAFAAAAGAGPTQEAIRGSRVTGRAAVRRAVASGGGGTDSGFRGGNARQAATPVATVIVSTTASASWAKP